MDDKAKIAERIVAARARLLEAVNGLTADDWDWEPGDGRWSARKTLAHVGSAQWSHLEVARGLLSGARTDLPGFDLDAWNQAQVAERAGWPVEQVLDDLEAAHAETLAFLAKLSTADLAVTGTHPALGEITVGQVLRIIGLHDGLHRRDILALRKDLAARRAGSEMQ